MASDTSHSHSFDCRWQCGAKTKLVEHRIDKNERGKSAKVVCPSTAPSVDLDNMTKMPPPPAGAAAAVALRFAARHSLFSSSVGRSRSLVVGVSASAAAALTNANAACRLEGDETNGAGRRKPRPPPRFTRHVPRPKVNTRTGRRSFSSSRGVSVTDESSQDVLAAAAAQGANKTKAKGDCPICRKYSKGPCGKLFTEWMACTDANPGKDEKTGEDLHLTKCAELAENLAVCLGQNADEYSGPIEYDDDEVNAKDGAGSGDIPIKDLADAWLELITELESSSSTNSRKPYPAGISPELEVRPSSGWGVGAFAPTDGRDEPLVLAYLKDQSGSVLAAGSGQDLKESGGYLRFQLDKEVESITTCAIYGGEGDDPIYEKIFHWKK